MWGSDLLLHRQRGSDCSGRSQLASPLKGLSSLFLFSFFFIYTFQRECLIVLGASHHQFESLGLRALRCPYQHPRPPPQLYPAPCLCPPHQCSVLDCRRFNSIDVPGFIQNPLGILELGVNTPFPSFGSIFTDPSCKNLI